MQLYRNRPKLDGAILLLGEVEFELLAAINLSTSISVGEPIVGGLMCVATVCRPNDDASIRKLLLDGVNYNSVNSINAGHLKFHQRYIRSFRSERIESLFLCDASATNFRSGSAFTIVAMPFLKRGWSSTARIRIRL